MFLKIEGVRSPITGSSLDTQHKGEIDIHSLSWGMEGNASATATAGGRIGGASQVSVSELIVTKGFDHASTGLLQALRSNEKIKRAVLTVRKAGGSSAPVEHLTIVLENARIKSFQLSGSEPVQEQVAIAFQKIAIEYREQENTGGSGATSRFETDLAPQ